MYINIIYNIIIFYAIMYVIPAEALGIFIVNSGAVLEEAVYYSIVSLHIQSVPEGKDLTSRECSLGQTIPI
jgi:hypothetical protein